MRSILLLAFILVVMHMVAQQPTYEQKRFCRNLEQVLEDGRQENFESLNGMSEKQSPLLPVPGYSIKLDPFGIIYVDKDHRFIGKTNQSFDSLSALQELEKLKEFTAYCLDTATWHWSEKTGNDSATVFFTEEKQLIATGPEFIFSLAMDKVANKVYTVNLYIKRRRR